MKRLSGILLLLSLLILGCQTAWAMNGEDLADGMKSYVKAEKDYTPADFFMAGNYLGYIQGVAEATTADYSFPNTLTPDDLCRVVTRYLEKHPDKWKEPASNLVRQALAQAYPKYIIRTPKYAD